MNFDFNKAPNSQNLPDVVKLNFAINILPTSLMLKKSLIGYKPFFTNLMMMRDLILTQILNLVTLSFYLIK